MTNVLRHGATIQSCGRRANYEHMLMHPPPAKIVIKTKEMWYKSERKAFLPTHMHTYIHAGQTDQFSAASLLPFGPGGSSEAPHLSPRPTTDQAAVYRPRRSHESSSINVKHQTFPRCFYHPTSLHRAIPSSTLLGLLSFTQWPRLRFLSTVGWGTPMLPCYFALCAERQRINTSPQT